MSPGITPPSLFFVYWSCPSPCCHSCSEWQTSQPQRECVGMARLCPPLSRVSGRSPRCLQRCGGDLGLLPGGPRTPLGAAAASDLFHRSACWFQFLPVTVKPRLGENVSLLSACVPRPGLRRVLTHARASFPNNAGSCGETLFSFG